MYVSNMLIEFDILPNLLWKKLLINNSMMPKQFPGVHSGAQSNPIAVDTRL